MNLSKIFRRNPYIYLNNDETNKLLDDSFKEIGPVSIQFLWFNMIKSFLEKNKPVVSVPYKGMILLISDRGEFLKSPKFQEILYDDLEFKNGEDRLINFYMGDFKSNPVLANTSGVISNTFPNWLVKELRGDYVFGIMLNMRQIFNHVKQILEKDKISSDSNLETFYKKGFKITYNRTKTIDVYDIAKKWLLCGLTIDVLESFTHLYMEEYNKKGHGGIISYESGKQSFEKRIKGFTD